MSDWAYNPAHGWSQGPYDGIGDYKSYPYETLIDGFFPAPAGMQWVDLSGPQMGMPLPLGIGGFGGGCGGCGGGFGNGGFIDPMMGGLGGIAPVPGYPGLPMMSGGLVPGMGIAGLSGPGPSGASWQQIGHSVNNGDTPGINFKNPTGGIGLEPGYNYIFPDEHCKVHVLKTRVPPWQLEGSEQIEFQAHMVPTCVTLQTLLDQFGCNNKDKGKNTCYEVSQGGGGKWYKGLTVKGDKDELMKKRVGDMGWGGKRNGEDQDVVWLYFTKD